MRSENGNGELAQGGRSEQADRSVGTGAEAPPLVGWYPAPVALGMVGGYPQRERTQLGCGLWVLVVCSRKARSAGSK